MGITSGVVLRDPSVELNLAERKIAALSAELERVRLENNELRAANRGYMERHMKAYEGYLRGNAADRERHPFRVALMLVLPFVGVAAGTVIALACVMR